MFQTNSNWQGKISEALIGKCWTYCISVLPKLQLNPSCMRGGWDDPQKFFKHNSA